LIPVEPEQMAAIVDPVQIGQLLRAMSGYAGEPLTRLGMNLVPYIFPRPIEFRTMEWAHITVKRRALAVPLEIGWTTTA
jgi:hypothetical protein